jgi:hypothetical protein
MKMILALAFVPTTSVIAAYEDLLDSGFYLSNDESLQAFLLFFEST